MNEYVRPGLAAAEFRGFPFIGDDSVKAYRFLLAAGAQDKLWNLQEALYRNQGGENEGWVTDDLVRELAAEIDGLDVDRLFAEAEGDAIVAQAEGAEAAGQAAGMLGTPSSRSRSVMPSRTASTWPTSTSCGRRSTTRSTVNERALPRASSRSRGS